MLVLFIVPFKGEGGKEKTMKKNIYLASIKKENIFEEVILAVTERETFDKIYAFVDEKWGSSDTLLLLHEGEKEVKEEPPKILHHIEVRPGYDELRYYDD